MVVEHKWCKVISVSVIGGGYVVLFFFFKQKTAYEIYQCDWSSDVCSSDLMVGYFRCECKSTPGWPLHPLLRDMCYL